MSVALDSLAAFPAFCGRCHGTWQASFGCEVGDGHLHGRLK